MTPLNKVSTVLFGMAGTIPQVAANSHSWRLSVGAFTNEEAWFHMNSMEIIEASITLDPSRLTRRQL